MIIINDLVDKYLEETNKKRSVDFKREIGRFWPTEASCIVDNKVQGKCARELYYSMTSTPITNVITARSLRIGEAGSMYEDKEIARVKNIQYYKDAAVKFNFKIPDTEITVAGKLDIIYQIDGKNIGGEIKSGYGYFFKSQVFNTATTPGFPVIKHLMQVMMYLYYFKYIDKATNIDEFYITYIDRGDCENTQFSIKLTDDDYPIIKNQESNKIYIMKDIKLTNPYLFNQNPSSKRDVNKNNKQFSKIKYYEISINNIFNRFKYIMDFITRKELPPKDYKYLYTLEDIEEMYTKGDINETKYEKLKEETDCDFNCKYCSFKKKCISDDGLYKFKE